MTEVNARPTELTVGAEPPLTPQVPFNQRRALLGIQNKSASAAVVYAKLGVPFLANVSAVQTISFGATPDGGTWTATDWLGNVTSALAANIDAATLQTALRALTGIGSGNVNVAGSMAAGFVLTFAGTLASQPIQPLTVQSALTLSTGEANAVQVIAFSAQPEAGTLTVGDWGGNVVSGLTAATLTAAELKVALNSLAQVNGGVATVTQDPVTKNFTVNFGSPLANQVVPLLSVVTVGVTNSDNLSSTQWTVQAAPTPAAGTICFTYGADLTTPLPFNMTAAQFQAALVALPGIGPGNVAVTGTSLAAGFTVALQGALANTHGLELHHCYNLLSIRYNAPAGIALGDVLVKVTRTVAGAGVAAVTASIATTTAGVAPSSVAASIATTTAGVTKPAFEGFAIAAGEHKEWGISEAPIDPIYIMATLDNTPVLVVEG